MRAVLAFLVATFLSSAGAQAQEQPDESSTGVLILGDSNAEGPFGGTLYDGLRTLRDPRSGEWLHVAIFAKCGAGANDWTSREYANIDCGAWACDAGRPIAQCHHFHGGEIPPLPQLYRQLHARRSVTIIALGLNMVKGNRARKLADAETLIDAVQAEGSGCIWIGPPQAGDGFVSVARYDSFVSDLRATVRAKGCRYISSADKTDRSDLGAHSADDHYDRPAAEAWARRVLAELQDRDDAASLANVLAEGGSASSSGRASSATTDR
jgi:hypothetical protein